MVFPAVFKTKDRASHYAGYHGKLCSDSSIVCGATDDTITVFQLCQPVSRTAKVKGYCFCFLHSSGWVAQGNLLLVGIPKCEK